MRTSPAAVDIGGTLVKFVYWRPPNPPSLPTYVTHENSISFQQNFTLSPARSLSVSCAPVGVLKFMRFPTTHAESFVQFLRRTKLHERYGPGRTGRVNATGGGAYKYAGVVAEQLGLALVQLDEMTCLVKGLNFLLRHCENEMFCLEPNPDLSVVPTRVPVATHGQPPFPYLVVNIGSGVSILKITGDETFVRVSGSGIGGGTFWGLTRLLTSLTSFEQVLECCKPGVGDNTAVDILVRDIYGDAAQNPAGLDPSVTASYFGKVQRDRSAKGAYKDADVVKSLVYMVSDNVAQLGFLNAQIHGVDTIVFAGGFVVDNTCVWQGITKAIAYWSKGKTRAMFLTHDGFLGALGALISAQPC
jgi:type II pantothenate kinase